MAEEAALELTTPAPPAARYQLAAGIAEAFANGNGFISELVDGGEHEVGQVVGGLCVDVVTNDQERGGRGAVSCCGDVVIIPVLGRLDQIWVIMLVVIGIKVKVSDMISKSLQVVLAAATSRAFGGAAGVWGTHVGGDLANNVAKRHFVLIHLIVTVG